MKTQTNSAIPVLLGLKLLVPRSIGLCHAYLSILAPRDYILVEGNIHNNHFIDYFQRKKVITESEFAIRLQLEDRRIENQIP
jgi:hypothetical protein